jgi:sugar-specific transcriptional regulator TrmB
MNRIILIGNGFDLAHGLKTGYRDFIDSYWKDFAKKYPESSRSLPCEDEFVKLENINGPKGGYEAWIGATYSNDPQSVAFIHFIEEVVNVNSYNELKQLIAEVKDASDLKLILSFKNKFFGHISELTCLNTWVDIENAYYEQLKICARNNDLKAIEKLNSDFQQIKIELEKYLSEIQKETISTNKDLFFQIYSPLHIEDFIEQAISAIREIYKALCETEKQKEFDKTFDWIMNNGIKHYSRKDYDDYVSGIHGISLYPRNVWFLNFNYTDTEKHYQLIAEKDTLNTNFHHYNQSQLWLEMCANRKIVHIHGELNNEKNPIIFGYGDELADEYKEIEKLNNNEYLKNVKSINYLKTDNYKSLLDFISSDYYQIFILGHSCGNSDRTLLNTLFEHQNCVSIKPFYYKRPDGMDNYEDIIMNISRNFNDKKAFREKVVNKTYCEPLKI